MDRNTFVKDGWTLRNLEDLTVCTSFDCGDKDLNEYFHQDVVWHREQLLTQTYCLFENNTPDLVLALVDFCNDKIDVKYKQEQLSLDSKIPYSTLPAVKITRIGVTKKLRGLNIGTHTINLTKQLFTTENRTGCRFITVDAYNKPEVIRFYEKNDFSVLTEKDKNKETRAMFFDLKRFKNT
jgi:hypothetical protein